MQSCTIRNHNLKLTTVTETPYTSHMQSLNPKSSTTPLPTRTPTPSTTTPSFHFSTVPKPEVIMECEEMGNTGIPHLFCSGSMCGVECQHPLQQPDCQGVCIRELGLEWHVRLLPHAAQVTTRLLVAHLPRQHRVCATSVSCICHISVLCTLFRHPVSTT